jgi:hypothetical protein
LCRNLESGHSSDGLLILFGCRQKAFIFVRKTLRVRPERSEDAEASSKLEEEDLRFSMKMMLAPAFETSLQFV